MFNTNPLVGIAAVVGGCSIGIVAVIAKLSPTQLWVSAPIIAVLGLMGILLASFGTRKGR